MLELSNALPTTPKNGFQLASNRFQLPVCSNPLIPPNLLEQAKGRWNGASPNGGFAALRGKVQGNVRLD
jgi:hypothetical protein